MLLNVSDAVSMVATGIRNSCEMELNRVLYNLSDSCKSRV